MATSLRALVLVIPLLMMAIAPVAPGAAPVIGIDTSFGDRVHEAYAAYRAKRYHEAIAKADVALAMRPDPRNASLLYALRGNAFWNLDDQVHTLRDYRAAVRCDPTVKGVRGRKGIAEYTDGNFATAIADLTAGLREPQGDPGYLYHSRGLAFLQVGQRARAREDFVQTTKAPAKGAQGYLDRADAFMRLGDAAQAARDFAQAKRMDPKEAGVLNSLAWLEATSPAPEFREGKAAVRDATHACEKSSWKDPEFIDTLAAAYAEQGDFGPARAWEQQALGLEANAASRKTLREHLALFEKDKPVREDRSLE